MVTLRWVTAGKRKFVLSHINPEDHHTHYTYTYYAHDLLAVTEYIIASFIEKYHWVAWKLFFDDRSYPNQEIDSYYILLKDMPNVKTIKNNNSTLSPIGTDNVSECNPQQLVKMETINEHEVLARIPGGDFTMVLPNVSEHTQLHDRLFFTLASK